MNLDRDQLEALLPHRPPILMLETVERVVPRERGTGRKTFTPQDSCFLGHFPGNAILPGVFVIEAFAQTAMAVFLADEAASPPTEQRLGLLAKVNDMTFVAKIVPGRTVDFAVVVERHVGPFAFVRCNATDGDEKFAFGKLALKIGE